MRRLILLFCIFVSLAATPTLLSAQAPSPILLYTTGILDSDGSVLYSVLLASTPESALSNVTITSTLPERATFVEALANPETATFVSESEGVVTWTLASLEADKIIGPFTYRVTFEETSVIPSGVTALVTATEGEAAFTPEVGELTELEDIGSITITPKGTEGIIPVGNTGVSIAVPVGAVESDVTFTFERLSVEEGDLPEVEEEIWWCYRFNVSIEPADTPILMPIAIFYPTRRTLTPRIPVVNFQKTADSDWQVMEGIAAPKPVGQREALIPTGIVTDTGNSIMVIAVSHEIRQFQSLGGVSVQVRTSGVTDGTSNTFVNPLPTVTLPQSWIVSPRD